MSVALLVTLNESGNYHLNYVRAHAMTSTLLLTLGLIPSMFFAFLVLTTFYGTTRAYVAISWLPMACGLIIWMFRLMLAFGNSPDWWWRDLSGKIAWASLIQAGLGTGLIARSVYKRQSVVALLIATLLSGFLFWLRLIR